MTTKSCGTCEFWDRNWAVKQSIGILSAECLAPVLHSLIYTRKAIMRETQGHDCAVYKGIKE